MDNVRRDLDSAVVYEYLDLFGRGNDESTAATIELFCPVLVRPTWTIIGDRVGLPHRPSDDFVRWHRINRIDNAMEDAPLRYFSIFAFDDRTGLGINLRQARVQVAIDGVIGHMQAGSNQVSKDVVTLFPVPADGVDGAGVADVAVFE